MALKDKGNLHVGVIMGSILPSERKTELIEIIRSAAAKESTPRTNADRIRAMSDEELASWAKTQIGCGAGFFPCGVVCKGKCETHGPEECRVKIMKWLRQPAEAANQGGMCAK